MTFPRRLLHEGEQVILDLRPHPVRLARPVTVTVILLGAAVYGDVAWRSAPVWFGILLGVVALLTLGYLATRILVWRTTKFVLTSARVIARVGVLRHASREIPIDRVTDVAYVQRLIERVIGAGTVLVESAGEHGTEAFPDLRDPAAIQSAINLAIEVRRARPATLVPLRPCDGEAEEEVAVEREELDDLHLRGVLTDEEYVRKVRELEGSP